MIVVPSLIGAQTQKGSLNLGSEEADIVRARDLTSQYVILANAKFSKDSAEYTKAFKLYADAYAAYGAWNTYLIAAIRAGDLKKRFPDAKYGTLSSNATKSATAFTSYVDQHTTAQSKAVTTIISSLADLGVSVWSKWHTQNESDRTAAATAFATDTKWQSWNEIIAAQPAGTSKPDPNTSVSPKI